MTRVKVEGLVAGELDLVYKTLVTLHPAAPVEDTLAPFLLCILFRREATPTTQQVAAVDTQRCAIADTTLGEIEQEK